MESKHKRKGQKRKSNSKNSSAVVDNKSTHQFHKHNDVNQKTDTTSSETKLQKAIIYLTPILKKLKILFYDSIGSNHRGNEEDPLSDNNNNKKKTFIPEPSYELEQLINMVKIPYHLEKLMIFTLLASIDGLLYYFTVFPIKIIQPFLVYGKDRHQLLSRTYKQRCTLFLIITACIVLGRIDTSQVYHRIKGQNTMKLYMLFNVLEMCDKMLASLGQSLLNVLLSNITSLHYRRDRYKQFFLIILSASYLIAHGYILIYQSISLNVAVNSYNNSLLALLLSVQFAEIKGSVFKKIDKEGLFQLSISDIIQRFKIFLLLLIIIIRNTGALINNETLSIASFMSSISNDHYFRSMAYKIMKLIWSPLVSVFSSEIIVDWIKHAYIIKFNRIRPEIYDRFYLIMYKDHNVSLSQFQERLGLTLPSFVVLFLVMVRPVTYRLIKDFVPLSNWPYLLATVVQVTWLIIVTFVILLILRFITHSILSQWGGIFLTHHLNNTTTTVTEEDYVPGEIVDGRGAMDRTTRHIIYESDESTPPSITERRLKHDKLTPDSLEKVARYQMVSKRIW